MGLFDSIGGFFGGDSAAGALAEGNAYAIGPWNEAMDWLYGQYENSVDLYTQNYETTLGRFGELFDTLHDQLQGYHESEMEQVNMGTEASQAALKQGFEGI